MHQSRFHRFGLVLWAVSAIAATPDFSGTWKLNRESSSFDRLPTPARFERTIVHHDPEIRIDTVQSSPRGDVRSSVKHVINGKETVNTVNGRQVKSTLDWNGDVLVIRSVAQVESTEIRSTENWRLSKDGRTLTTDSTVATSQGEVKLHLVLDKVPAP